jgi:hypothetical protein
LPRKSEVFSSSGHGDRLYFIFIVASTLRLDFALPAFTGIVAAAGYLGVTSRRLTDTAVHLGGVAMKRSNARGAKGPCHL